jgi:hypothetical protein
MNFIDKINTFLKTKNVKLWHILMASLVVNAFALLTLSRGLFIVFLLLSLNVAFLIRLSNIYILDNKNKINRSELNLINITQMFIFLSLGFFIHKKYQNKITKGIVSIFSIIIFLYILYISIKNQRIFYRTKYKLWGSFYTPITNRIDLSFFKDKLNILQQYTEYFNEYYTIIYLLILITYINYKK